MARTWSLLRGDPLHVRERVHHPFATESVDVRGARAARLRHGRCSARGCLRLHRMVLQSGPATLNPGARQSHCVRMDDGVAKLTVH